MSYGKGGGSNPQVDAPTNGPGMPPPLANAGVNPTNINATQPGQSNFGGKSVGTPETQEPYTPGAYDPGPVRSQQDRFQGYNVPTPNYAQFNQQVAQPLPGPVQPNVMPDNLPPGVEMGFGSMAPPGGPQELYSNYADKVFGTPDASSTLSGGPAGQPITNQPATASMTPQDYYTQYANTIFGTPSASYTPDFGTPNATYKSAVEGATDIYNQ
jgi:hypothetical protein|tara:strand:- start:4633 stop:5271 length:639 start_codon:yes stop_codon:yes gene_type:complete